MRTHKLTLCAFAAIAALATACSNDELAGNNIPQEGIEIEATASTPKNGADTRLTHTDGSTTMNIVWAAGDKFTACASSSNKTDYEIKTEDAGKASAAFTGTWDNTPTAGTIRALYPATTATDLTAIPLTLDGQDGTLGGLKNFNYMTASTTYSGTGDLSFGAFAHQVAIVKLALTFPSGVTGDATAVGLSATGLNKSIQMNLTDNNTSNELAGDITTGTNALTISTDGKLTAYLCIFPGALTNAKVVATAGGKNYEAALTDLTVAVGSMYTATVTVAEAVVNYIEVNGIKVATGNLVFNSTTNKVEIGTATDGGLFFQFGSLVGWSETGDATAVVTPTNYEGSTSWSSSWTGDPATDNEKTGTGDPCRYYLKGTWRLPISAEFETLFSDKTGYPSSGNWTWNGTSESAEHKDGLKIPASGSRISNDGSLGNVGSTGLYWSASPLGSDSGYNLSFSSSLVYPSLSNLRARGLAVRCVKGSN